MQHKRLLGIAVSLAVSSFAALTFTGCSSTAGSASTGATGANSPAMVVTAGDAPLNNILSANVTVSAISLTPTSGGSDVTVLSSSRTIELSSLGAIQEPIETANVAAGTYNAVNLTVSSATVTYVDSTGQVVTGTATVNSPNDRVTLNPTLTVTQGQDVHLSLNFNLAQSFDLTGTTLTFTPSITSAAASIEQENEAEREVEVTGSVVSVSSTSITVQSASTGVQSTFAINSSTEFSANTSVGSIKPGSIVTVQGSVQTDGSLLATMISASMNGDALGMSQGGGSGIVTAVTTSGGNVTSFTFVPREDFGDTSSASPLTVNLSSSTTYGVSQDAVQEGISAAAFTNAEIFPGQSVSVIGTTASDGSITAQEVDLAAESLSGTLAAAPQGTAPTYTFTLQLPAASFLTTFDSLTTLDAATNAQTQYEDGLTASSFGSLAVATNLEVHGYLLVDSSSNYSFTVADVSQISSDN
ncbi:MAG TPA: DUF4382 domain-containing protein [Acidobacteriaceae bacterium]|nr:DUF4382 domain-containing protein [Acidobacteriaceae bacterium]